MLANPEKARVGTQRQNLSVHEEVPRRQPGQSAEGQRHPLEYNGLRREGIRIKAGILFRINRCLPHACITDWGGTSEITSSRARIPLNGPVNPTSKWSDDSITE